MLPLLVAVAITKNLEPLDRTVHMLDANAVTGQIPVEPLLQRRQLALARLLEWNQAEGVQTANALVAFIRHPQNAGVDSDAAPLEQLEIVDRAFGLMDANDFSALPVDQDLVFDGVAFLLAGIRFGLFFWGRSVSHSIASTTTTRMSASAFTSARLEGKANVPFLMSACSTHATASLMRCLWTP